MNETEQNRLMDHEYDGIQEYDNPLPAWWKWTFILTAVFSVVYGIYYHLGGPGLNSDEEYQAEMATFFAEQAKRGGGIKVTEQMLAGMVKNQELISATRNLYASKCAQCHGALGEGKIGPNLTDKYWLHGSSLMDIYTVIDKGVPAKGMLAWGRQLGPGQIANLAAYVASLRGSNPPGAKAPQGEAAP